MALTCGDLVDVADVCEHAAAAARVEVGGGRGSWHGAARLVRIDAVRVAPLLFRRRVLVRFELFLCVRRHRALIS